MADFDVQAEVIAENYLELILPQAGSVTVAPPAISQDKQVVGICILLGSELCPPGADRIDGELGRVTGGADGHKAVIT